MCFQLRLANLNIWERVDVVSRKERIIGLSGVVLLLAIFVPVGVSAQGLSLSGSIGFLPGYEWNSVDQVVIEAGMERRIFLAEASGEDEKGKQKDEYYQDVDEYLKDPEYWDKVYQKVGNHINELVRRGKLV